MAVALIPSMCLADAPRNSIPRSTQSGHYQSLREAATATEFNSDDDASAYNNVAQNLLKERPPWNPSNQIDDAGFLQSAYARIPGQWEAEIALGGKHQNPLHLELVQCRIRQVPGDGNCLFHSISTCMARAVNGTTIQYPNHLGWLYRHSASLRQQAVECLRQKRKVLFLQGNEYLRAKDLVEAAAAQYGITGKDYCDLMQQDSYWGGGPEIVALCNVLKRPIHVYELATSRNPHGGNGFVLRRMACFGSPKFDKKEPFHILSADSRFPDVAPGKQLSSGNHFLAVFPIPEQQAALEEWIKREKKRRKKRRKQQVRGGGGAGSADLFEGRQQHLSELEQRRIALEEAANLDESEYDRSDGESSSVREYLWSLCRRMLFLS